MAKAILTLLSCSTFVMAGSLSLDDAIHEALEGSTQVLILKDNVENSKEVVNQVESIVYPQLTFSASAGYGQSPLGIKTGSAPMGQIDSTTANVLKVLAPLMSFDTDPRSSYRWAFNVTQPIYTFGKLTTAIKVAEYQDSATRQSYRRGRQDVQIIVVQSYAALVMSQKSLAILQSSQKRSQQLHDDLERNFKNGSGSKADLLRAEASLTQVNVKLAEAERDLAQAQMSLNQLLGRPLNQEISADTSIEKVEWIRDTLASTQSLLDQGRQNRSDLKALEMQRRIYEGGVTIDEAGYLPSIALQGRFGVTAYDDVANAIKWENRDWSVGVGLTWTLFDGFSNKATASQKRIQSHILDRQKNQTDRQMEVDITRLVREVEVAHRNQNASAQMVRSLQESRDLLGRDFKAGQGNLSDVLGVEESLEQAQLAVLSAQWQELRAKAQLRYVLGLELTGAK